MEADLGKEVALRLAKLERALEAEEHVVRLRAIPQVAEVVEQRGSRGGEVSRVLTPDRWPCHRRVTAQRASTLALLARDNIALA